MKMHRSRELSSSLINGFLATLWRCIHSGWEPELRPESKGVGLGQRILPFSTKDGFSVTLWRPKNQGAQDRAQVGAQEGAQDATCKEYLQVQSGAWNKTRSDSGGAE
jgi:hypothetical protein